MVIGIVGALASLLLPALSAARGHARRSVCINNLKQVNLSLQAYCEQNQETLPFTNRVKLYYVFLAGFQNVKVGPAPPQLPVVTSPLDRSPLICPADRWAHGKERRWERWTLQNRFPDGFILTNTVSYCFNGGNVETNRTSGLALQGIAGRKLHSIREPSRTVLLVERTAFGGLGSMHEPPKSAGPLRDQRNMLSFVDGHVSYNKIYVDAFENPADYADPPAGYDYKWSGQ
jgi:type II secretory pathway pseudopilin PulG